VQKLYFVERLLGLVRVTATDSGLTLKPLLGKPEHVVPVSDRLFRKVSDPVATLALVDDPEDGRAQAIERMGYLLPVSYHRAWTVAVWLELGLTGLFVLSLASTLLFALVWIPRWLFGKLAGVPKRHIRVWPLLATFALATWIAVFALKMNDVIPALGRATPWAWTLTVTSVAFPLFALIGLLAARRAAEVNGFVRWQARIASAAFVIASAYLAWFGMVGWRSWG